jgi:type VI secretion system secreted protein VgrG
MAGTRLISMVGATGEGLTFSRMDGQEALGRPFKYELEVLAQDHALDLAALLGKTLTVQLELESGGARWFNGHVTRLVMAGSDGRYARYRATLRPWTWLLTRNSNCRIFQGQTVPEIVKQIFRESGFSDFKESLSGDYPPLEYLVQYRESDFHFVSRLMEQAGIYFFFVHEPDKHTLVLADAQDAHRTGGVVAAPYFPPSKEAQVQRVDHLDTWSASLAICSGAYVATDYDFERPAADLFARRTSPGPYAQGDRELYDYPGQYLSAELGQRHVQVRLEEHKVDEEVCQAAGNLRELGCGGLLRLGGYPRDDQNKEYLVTACWYELVGRGLESDAEQPGEHYRARFDCLDVQRPYRTPATTPRPRVEGPQTATVVGKPGEEIWTDKYGRVKVRFHWDREGNPNATPDPHWNPPRDPPRPEEESSCWVRVAQVWAGANWGAMHIPRVGHEVIVDFLEGDPDRPIVTGRVYNGKNMPPYELPANQTQSGIKSRSSKDGAAANFNEIRFEDRKGGEELHIQAEKDQSTLVKNNQSITVGADRSRSVGGNESVSVDKDRSVHVKGNLSVTVDGGGKSAVHSTLSVTGKHSVHASDTIDVDAPTHILLQCQGSSLLMEPGKITLTAGGKSMVVMDTNLLCQSSAGTQVFLDANLLATAKSGGQMLMDANVLLQSKGGTSILLDGNAAIGTGGNASVTATMVQMTGSQKVTAGGATASLELAAAGAALSGTKASLTGVGITEISGALIKIN